MKKNRRILQIVALTLVAVSCASCPSTPSASTPDSEIFGNVEPLEWKDSYVFATTWYPPQIQVWDEVSDTCCKLVRTYSLEKNGRSLSVYGMAVLDESLWFIGAGRQYNLIRLDLTTGEMHFLDVNCNPESIAAFDKSVDGIGSVWVASASSPRVGIKAQHFDSDGNLLDTVIIRHSDLDVTSIRGLQYVNGNYFMTASKMDYYQHSKNEIGYKIVNLSEGTVQEEFSISEVVTDELFDEKIEASKNNSLFVSAFNIVSPVSSYSKSAPNNGTCAFLEASVIFPEPCYRFLFKVKSLVDKSFEYTNICYDKNDARSFFSVSATDSNIFITGRLLGPAYESDTFSGLEVGKYASTGGEQISKIRLPNGNQLYQTVRNGKSYFCKDIQYQDENTYEWKTEPPQIYMLEHSTGNVYAYNADGTRAQLKEVL